MRKLTDEEIDNIHQGLDEKWNGKVAPYGYIDEGAKAQLKKLMEWGNGHCEHDTDNIPTRLRHNCSDCWQALLGAE